MVITKLFLISLTFILPANSSIALDSSLPVPRFPFQGQVLSVGNDFVQLCDSLVQSCPTGTPSCFRLLVAYHDCIGRSTLFWSGSPIHYSSEKCTQILYIYNECFLSQKLSDMNKL